MRRALLPLLFCPLFTSADPLTIHENWVQNPSCSSPTGLIDITPTGGTPPYTFAWSNSTSNEDASGLGPGYVEVTVTDAMSAQITQGWTLTAVPLSSPQSAQDGHASCIGQMGGEVQVIEWGINGVPPYTYSPMPAGTDPQGDPYFIFPFAPIGSTVYIDVTDANGCTGTLSEPVVGPQPNGGPIMVLQNVQASCSGGTGGSVTITNVNDGAYFQGPAINVYDAGNNIINGSVNPANTVSFNGFAPGHYHVERDWNFFFQYTPYPCDNHDSLGFDIPDLGVACGTVSGDVFIDNDDDCVQDVSEVGVPELVLQIDPGGTYAITDPAGHYSVDLIDGSYTLAQNDATLIQLCPVAVPVPFTIAGDAQIIQLADSSTVPLDLQAMISGSAAHPGFSLNYALKVKNLSAQVSGPVTVVFTIDPSIIYTSASIAPTSIAGNVITWDLAAFAAYEQRTFTVQCDVPIASPLGISISASMNVSNTLAEANLANNTVFTSVVVTGSFDPNEKIARTSSGWSDQWYFVDVDQYIDYTIRFQNTGTSPAINVVVTDTLSEALDMGSFESGAVSDPVTINFKPGRVVEWTFTNINLPDSGSDEAASHGLVGFRIRLAQPLLAGVLIRNAANIYFDLNDPIITNDVTILTETSTQVQEQGQEQRQLHLFPNPASSEIKIAVAQDHMRSVEIISADGRTIARRDAMDRSLVINVDDLASGIYLISARLESGIELHARFIKR